jgi:glycosyltransferase involved in cell wall biosynthesis
MYLSVIIPAYNEEQRIRNTLHVIQADLQRQLYAAEIIVVDDGSQDGTASLVRTFDTKRPSICLLQNDRNRGKGFSVRQGFLHARGAYLLFSDVVWRNSAESRVRVWRDSIAMLNELLRIRWNGVRGRYDRPTQQTLNAVQTM